ncbi:hypothetical protein MAPG_06603 [Magnaporthiopsis poae ATCC 64411]|uniref:Uncharacterized protein n=1 Tax=Magnaporthiopsis poae (strain ATCC 64411 / 73-15) TaxID=644358 RepID=A0A0C4E2G7_MAGP6|nr:hypothetical protein MAPG_06603 [Magnaporthiopsis poae ATCC 64411]
MSVDMVLAEHQAPAELGDEPGFDDVVEQDVSMMAHEGLDDITFDADDGYIGYSAPDEAAQGPALSIDQQPVQGLSDEESGLVDTHLDQDGAVDADLLPLADAVEEENDTAADTVIAHTTVSEEVGASEFPEDHQSRSGLQAAGSPVTARPSMSEDDGLAEEIDYEDNEGNGEILLEVVQQFEPTHENEADGDEGVYPNGQEQDPRKPADLEQAALSPEPNDDPTHTMPPNEEPDSPATQQGGEDAFDVNAKDHEDDAGPEGMGLDPDAERALSPDQADLSVEDHHQRSISEDDQEEDYDGEEDVDYMDVAEVDDQASDEFSARPHVRIQHRNTTYSLFSGSTSDDPYSFFFSDLEALEHPLSQFLAGLREVLSDEITPDEELLIRIDGLGLEFAETMEKSSLDRITFGTIVDLHDRLVKADNPHNQDVVLLVYLVTRPNTLRRLDSLLDGASIGEGLSAYHISYPDYMLVDFPPKEDSKETTAQSTPRTTNGYSNADFESGLGPDEDDEPDEIQDADPESPSHTNVTPDWHGSAGGADQEEDQLGDSYDQVIDETHERTSACSRHSGSRQSSPSGSWDHETGGEAVGEQQTEASAYERAQSEVKDTDSNQGSDRSDAYSNPDVALDEIGEETEPAYQRQEHLASSHEQELDRIDDLITEELETSGKGEAEGDVATGSPSYTADDKHDLGSWEDGLHDAEVADGEGSVVSPTRDPEPNTPREAGGEAWDAINAQETVITDDQPFEMLRRQSAADTADLASLDHSSASATLDGEEVDLQEVLSTVGPAEDDQLKDDVENPHEEAGEADEIDWEDNENDGIVADGITSTPSSNIGKRVREVDDGEGPGDGHDVKRHRT